ncbi:MAG: dTMP kinase [Acidobacteria bacterium]|nr:dTMP kinase [Acidobacteriota bacterium]MBV9626044.1 dTMP kinase [Acidobacteriota bacterium]
MAHKRAAFITFEGLDGCGKSTQVERLAACFVEQGFSVLVTREPGGTANGERIRQLLLDTRTARLAPLTELALMFAARVQHVEELIRPALDAGQMVICDRFTDSSEAYQGGGRRLGKMLVLELHRLLCGDLQPDLTILMDSDITASVGRARRRNQARTANQDSDENRFELENRAFFARVQAAYLEIAKREPQRVFLVDARGTADQTHTKILEVVSSKLGLNIFSKKAQNRC